MNDSIVVAVAFCFWQKMPPKRFARLVGRQRFLFGRLFVDLFAVLGAAWLCHTVPQKKSQREGWL